MLAIYAVWSVCAWTIGFAVQMLLAVVCFPLLLLKPFERFQGGWPSDIMGALPKLTFSRLTLLWDRDYDPRRVCVYTANHTSMLDGHVAIYALPHPFCGVENAAHLAIPGYGWIMRLANAIPIPRGEQRTEAVVAAARERASRGISVLAFPEAHRTMTGHVRPFKRGVFVMARAAGLPVVPMGIRGMYHVFPKGTWIVRPGYIEVYLGPPLETAGVSDEALDALVTRANEIVTAWVDRRETVNPDPFVVPRRPGDRERIPVSWMKRTT